MAAGMVTGDGVTRQERYLVHQVHPAKLATDIGAAAVSTVLFWRYQPVQRPHRDLGCRSRV